MLLTNAFLENSKHFEKFKEILSTRKDKDKIEFLRERYLDIKIKNGANNAIEGINLYIYKYMYLMPVIEAILFLYKTTYADKFVNILSKYEFTLNGQTIPITTNALFSYMQSYEKEMVKCLINELGCHNIISEQLFDTIVEDKYCMFTQICCDNNLSLDKVIKICTLYESINLDFIVNRNMDYSDGFDIKLLEFNYISKRTINFFSYSKNDDLLTRFYKERNNIIFLFIVILNFLDEIDNKYRNHIISFLNNTEFEDLNVLFMKYKNNHIYTTSPSEYSIIDKIRFELNLHYENLKPLNEYINTTKDITETIVDNKDDAYKHSSQIANNAFIIPIDYFKQNPKKVEKGGREYYEYNSQFITKNDSQKFTNFINYLADCGYIENNNETKMLFAYRLTGRMRPKKLEKIIWHSQRESNRCYELLYIVKYISGADGKYELTKDFFEGPEWGPYPNQDANNKNPRKKFREKLHEMYEDIFPEV